MELPLVDADRDPTGRSLIVIVAFEIWPFGAKGMGGRARR
jgi:hypothetical protein